MNLSSASRPGPGRIALETGGTTQFVRAPFVVDTLQTNGAIVYVLATEDTAPFGVVIGTDDPESRAVLDALPVRRDRSAAARVLTALNLQMPEPVDGRIELLDGVLSIATARQRWDIVVGADAVPIVIEARQIDNETAVARLAMPDGGHLHLRVRDQVDAAFRALAVLRAAPPKPPSTTRPTRPVDSGRPAATSAGPTVQYVPERLSGSVIGSLIFVGLLAFGGWGVAFLKAQSLHSELDRIAQSEFIDASAIQISQIADQSLLELTPYFAAAGVFTLTFAIGVSLAFARRKWVPAGH